MKYLKLSFIFLGLIVSILLYSTEISIQLDEKGNYKETISISCSEVGWQNRRFRVMGDAIQKGDSFYINITSSDVNLSYPPTYSFIARENNLFNFNFQMEEPSSENVTLNIEIKKNNPLTLC